MSDRGHFRAYPRRPTRVSLSARLGDQTAPRIRLVDVCLGGAGLETSGQLDVGSRVELVLQAPSRWDPLVLVARVAWAQGRRAGLAFEMVDDRDVWALFELLGVQTFDR